MFFLVMTVYFHSHQVVISGCLQNCCVTLDEYVKKAKSDTVDFDALDVNEQTQLIRNAVTQYDCMMEMKMLVIIKYYQYVYKYVDDNCNQLTKEVCFITEMTWK